MRGVALSRLRGIWSDGDVRGTTLFVWKHRVSVFSCSAMIITACSGETIDLPAAPIEASRSETTPPSANPSSPASSSSSSDASSTTTDAGTDASPPKPASHFECKQLGANAYRPYWVQVTNAGVKDWSATPKGLLGQNAMTTQAECDQARAAANDAYGVICSRTGLDGWKPTLYTGTVPGRADFGYLGGSSIMAFADCLKATKNSSEKGVCYWGGSDWYAGPIDQEGTVGGPFVSLDACIAQTK